MQLITTRSTCLLLLLVTITFKLQFLPALLAGPTNNDAFLSIIFISAAEILILSIFLFLSTKYPGFTFKQLLEFMFNKTIAKIILILFGLQFFVKTIAAFMGDYIYLIENIYSVLPWYVFVFPIGIILLYVITSGLKSIGRMAEVFLPIIIFALLAAIIFGLTGLEYAGALPIYENGFLHSTLPVFNYTNWFGNLLVYIVVMGNIKQSKNHNKWVIASVIAGCAVVALFYFIYYCMFGFNAGNYTNALADTITVLPGNTDIGGITWLIILAWAIAVFLYLAVMAYGTTFCFAEAFGKKLKPYIAFVVIAVTIGVSVALNFDIARLVIFSLDYLKYFDWAMQYLLPVVLLIFSFRLKKRAVSTNKTQEPNEEESKARHYAEIAEQTQKKVEKEGANLGLTGGNARSLSKRGGGHD